MAFILLFYRSDDESARATAPNPGPCAQRKDTEPAHDIVRYIHMPPRHHRPTRENMSHGRAGGLSRCASSVLVRDSEPLFPKMMESTDAKLGNSFIASGSLRLPVAVLKAIESFVSPSQKIGREIPTRDPSSAAMLVPRRTPRPQRTGRRRRGANHIGKESANGAGQGHQADVGWPARVTSTRGRRGCVSIISVGTLQRGRGRRERE